VVNILDGHSEQIRDFFGKLDTFTDKLNQQRDDITRPFDSPIGCCLCGGPR